jgi:hypothetical protein
MPDLEVYVHVVEAPHSATAYFSDGLQVVTFFQFPDEMPIPVTQEVRSWRATRALTENELSQMFKRWTAGIPANIKAGINSDEVRGIPVGRIFRTMQARINEDSLVDSYDFKVPNSEEIEEIINSRLIPDNWRNNRDFKAHARELRSIKIYLNAVYVGESAQPMREIVDREDVTIGIARKIIDQARSHGYLTRVDGSIGGLVTDKARECARIMMRADEQAKKEKA